MHARLLLITCLNGSDMSLPVLIAVQSFLYQPQTGQLWDPSCFAIPNGTFYCVAMYSEHGDSVYSSGWLATSNDGVHWRDVGPIAPSEPGTQWWKGFVLQLGPGPSFVMNHGVFEHDRYNDALRILTSSDLIHWHVKGTSRPDSRWYNSHGRWDHMYMSADPAGGFVGFPVSSPLASQTFANTWPGVQRSPDGIQWTAHAPLNVTWGGVTAQSIEEGGFELLEGGAAGQRSYYLIGGGAGAHSGRTYSMWVFRSDNIDGPYRPATRRFRLSGGSTQPGFEFGALAVWCRGRNGERLISQYMTAAGRGRADVWMLPLRKPLIDASGDLRLAYWRANDALLGPPLPSFSQHAPLLQQQSPRRIATTCSPGSSQAVTWLAEPDIAAHRSPGLYLNATIHVSGEGAVGLALGDFTAAPTLVGAQGSPGYTAMLLDIGNDGDVHTASRVLHVRASGSVTTLDVSGFFSCGDGNLTCGVATPTAIAPGLPHHFLLFFANGMWEWYVDGLLVQSFVYGGVYPLPRAGAGRVGIACAGEAQAIAVTPIVGKLDRTERVAGGA